MNSDILDPVLARLVARANGSAILPSPRPSRLYRVTSLDTGYTNEYTERQAKQLFGVREWHEITSGFVPHLVAERVR